MTRTILDIHVLQTVPPSNLNRDETGTPKSAVYGGVRRARVSSQAWKRATRETFNELLEPSELGVRTREVAKLLADRVKAVSPALEPNSVEVATLVLQEATGAKIEVPKRKTRSKKDKDADPTEQENEETGSTAAPESAYLMFLSTRQLDALAHLAAEGSPDGDPSKLKGFLKENRKRAREAVNTRHSVDIALFGRMVADNTDLNVDAATQVAHALSVHQVEQESDYYTAVDDEKNRRGSRDEGEESAGDRGAGMIGTVDFNSATLYRYAALDVDRLHENLGQGPREDDPLAPTLRAVDAFLQGFVHSLPSGKVNSFGNNTLPSAVVVKLRTRRPISFVGAFENPVPLGEGGGYLKGACAQLAQHGADLEQAYGVLDADHSWVFRYGPETADLAALGSEVTLEQLLSGVGTAVKERLRTDGKQQERKA